MCLRIKITQHLEFEKREAIGMFWKFSSFYLHLHFPLSDHVLSSILGEILELNPRYKAPPDYKPLLKEARLPIHVRSYLVWGLKLYQIFHLLSHLNYYLTTSQKLQSLCRFYLEMAHAVYLKTASRCYCLSKKLYVFFSAYISLFYTSFV